MYIEVCMNLCKQGHIKTKKADVSSHRIPGCKAPQGSSWQKHGLDKVAQHLVQLNLKSFQSWGIYHSPGQFI